jgi:dTDP-4-dehydrorhamnose reductase
VRWLITGARGQLGSDLQKVLAADSVDPAEILALGSAELDITDRAAVSAAFADIRPDVVINTAAYTAVDNAETDEDRAYAVNATGPALLAAEAARDEAKLIQVSTDYVFPGDGTDPYEIDAATGPRTAYGRTKLAGEQAVRVLAPNLGYVVRTAWVFSLHHRNFVTIMTERARTDEVVDVVQDQRGSPTWSEDLARGLVELARSDTPAGILHCTNAGDTTWFDLATAVFIECGADPAQVRSTTSDRVLRPARRPAYSALSDRAWRAAGLTPLQDWRAALHQAFRDSSGTTHQWSRR